MVVFIDRRVELNWKKKVVGGLRVNVCCESEVVRKKRDQPWKLEGTLYLSPGTNINHTTDAEVTDENDKNHKNTQNGNNNRRRRPRFLSVSPNLSS